MTDSTTRPSRPGLAPAPNLITAIVDVHADDGAYDLGVFAASGGVALVHKLSEGGDFNDRDVAHAMDAAAKAGLLRALYHFGNATDAEHQADHFLERAAPYPDALLVLDCEANSKPRFGTMTADIARAFVLRVREKTGRMPVFYSFTSFLRGLRLSRGDVLGSCPLWQAQYGERPTAPASPAWDRIDLWQYTNGTEGPHDQARYPRKVAGFARAAQDRSAFEGTADELRAWWRTAGGP